MSSLAFFFAYDKVLFWILSIWSVSMLRTGSVSTLHDSVIFENLVVLNSRMWSVTKYNWSTPEQKMKAFPDITIEVVNSKIQKQKYYTVC